MKLSIIVPVYNVEKYIFECLDSIINQPYKDFELILVDDGSPDNCPIVCDEYATQDKRIKVIHKENGGLSSARNAGLEIAKGEYVFFLDSDDALKENVLETMISSTHTDQDIYCFNYDIFNGEKIIKEMVFPAITECKDMNDNMSILFKKSNWSVWNKLYKTSFLKVNNFHFNEENYGSEDLEWIIDLFSTTHNISSIDKSIVLYRITNVNSITNTLNSRKYFCLMKVFDKCHNVFNNYCLDDEVKYICYNKLCDLYISAIFSLKYIPKIDKKRLIEELRKRKYLLRLASGKKQKAMFLMINMIGYTITSNVINLLLNMKSKLRRNIESGNN